jgi:hypothetical protein
MAKVQGKNTTNAPIIFDSNFTQAPMNTSCHQLSQVLLPAEASLYFSPH